MACRRDEEMDDAAEAEPDAPSLLSLPPDLLRLVILCVRGQGGRHAVRQACSSLRNVVDGVTQKLKWGHKAGPSCPLALLASRLPCMLSLTHLDMSGARHVSSLQGGGSALQGGNSALHASSLQGGSSALHASSLPPQPLLLHACGGLQSLSLNGTAVSDLGPLSGCTALLTLDLSACTRLERLDPLAACTRQQVLKGFRV